MLFKKEHVPMIMSGRKTATRRAWKSPMAKIGGIYKAKLSMFKPDCFAKIRVTAMYNQKLKDMSQSDYEKEGYNSKEEFMSIWKEINHYWNPDMNVTVIEFALVEENM